MNVGSEITLGKSPLELKAYFFPLVSFRAFPSDEDVEKAPVTALKSVESQLSLADAEKNIWEVTLTVSSDKRTDSKPLLFEYQIECTGHFQWMLKSPVDKNLERFIAATCFSILYSSIRDCLATVSGKGPYGPCVLPTIEFRPTLTQDVPALNGKSVVVPKTNKKREHP